MKAKGERIVCLTAYDFPTAAIADAVGVDLILVGDSLGNVVLGYENTLPVTLDEMEHHVRAARRGVKEALFVADMPFGSYGGSVAQCMDSAVRLMKAGAEAVKLEGPYVEEIRALVKAGIPVMGHVGMTPQSVNSFGGFRVQGKGEDANVVREAACCVQEAGAFAIVLELMPRELAATVTKSLEIPTIGIGAGPDCDGEIQVFHDVVGLSSEVFKHSRDFVGARSAMVEGLSQYASEVRARKFPADENSF
jgi:3-methyl-2-oxobutanoate hydroxymethyltransferase